MKKHRIYLENTYPDREVLKKLPGAKYDGQQKQWWIPVDADKKLFRKWLPEISRIKIFLNVPIDEVSEAAAQAAGARYDEIHDGFYILEHEADEALQKWIPRMYRKNAAKPYLEINLVPKTSYHKNLHSLFLLPEMWDVLKKEIYRRAGYRCEICGDQSVKANNR